MPTRPDWLKSALQQGVVRLPGALQAAPAPTKRVFGPVQADCGPTMQIDPRQHAPSGGAQGLGEQTEPAPWKAPVHAPALGAEAQEAPEQHAPGATIVRVSRIVPAALMKRKVIPALSASMRRKPHSLSS